MKTLLTIFLLSLPCSALSGELRIVKCTQGLAAVQEYAYGDSLVKDGLGWRIVKEWRTLPAGCVPEEAAKRMYAEEIAWRNRPPAPSVIEPVEVIEP